MKNFKVTKWLWNRVLVFHQDLISKLDLIQWLTQWTFLFKINCSVWAGLKSGLHIWKVLLEDDCWKFEQTKIPVNT